MSEKICFNLNAFLLGLVIVTIIILLFNKYFIEKECPSCKPIIINKELKQNTIPQAQQATLNEKINKNLDNRDSDALNDDLSAPTRRLPKHLYPTYQSDFLTDIPTRGEPDNYHYYGNLVRNSDDKIVKLFGRQLYQGSSQYEYYGIISNLNYGTVKIPIKSTNDKELYDGDEIDIEVLGKNEGKFKLYMNDYDRPRYNPFTYRN